MMSMITHLATVPLPVHGHGLLYAVVAFILFIAALSAFSIKAQALTFIALPGGSQDGRPFSIILPPVRYNANPCQAMLDRMVQSGVLSEGPQANIPAQDGLAVVVGFHFSFGGPAKRAAIRTGFGIWQPTTGIGERAQAMGAYRDCRNDKAMRAAFGD